LLITGTKVVTTKQPDGTEQYFGLSNSGLIPGFGANGVYVVNDVNYNETAIAIPNNDLGYPTGVNSSGYAVGLATSISSQGYGWTFKNGAFAKYNYPGSTGCTLNAVNDSGDLAGTYYLENKHEVFYAFVSIKGRNAEISVPNCVDPNPSAISNTDIVVGSAVVNGSQTSGQLFGFVRGKSGQVTTVNYKSYAPKMVTGPSGQVPLSSQYQTEVFGVNSSGQIVGLFTGTYVDSSSSWSETIYIPFIGTPK
jgi:hypothetical protein